jgi:hypothetical protein
METRSGALFKLGDGPFNFGWNKRHCRLEGNQLLYYASPTEKNPRGTLDITEVGVSQIYALRGRDFSFSL